MKDEAPSRSQDKFVIRFPDGMRDQIAESASLSGRSMNAEIVYRLYRSMEELGPLTEPRMATSERAKKLVEAHAKSRAEDGYGGEMKNLLQAIEMLKTSFEDFRQHANDAMERDGKRIRYLEALIERRANSEQELARLRDDLREAVSSSETTR